ncbi:hypothetical protein EVJ32_10915 [Exiguobacterium sp. SH5S4]|uniref:hypothetical protein n=1 Tax=Exiguobacterium sp. SH5S4 TaxID=2510961 RepID=UPI0010396D77|nr:hypothetical protein [Exiguobacterium sp. SH5S4]TCI25302.1 hypothetical protein EVJ32_10915 [Exiguobacterium sp. SH5S4]
MQLQSILETFKGYFLVITAIGGWLMFMDFTKKLYWDYWTRSWKVKQITFIYVITILVMAFGYFQAWNLFMGEWEPIKSETELILTMLLIVGMPILSDWVIFQYDNHLRKQVRKLAEEMKKHERKYEE